MNYIKINKAMDYQLLQLSRQDHAHLKDIIAKDSKFLHDKGMMDYSLLIAVEKHPECQQQNGDDNSESTFIFQNTNASQIRHTYT